MHLDTPVQPQDSYHVHMGGCQQENRIRQNPWKGSMHQRLSGSFGQHFLSAIQNSEGHIKGTIQKGKYADFVILDRDPLSTDPDDLINIQVMETLVGGQTVYMKGEKNEQ